MRKVLLFAMLFLSLSMGLPYALNGQWWGLFASILTGTLWAYPSPKLASLRSTISLLIFASISALGIFFNHSYLWLLTNFTLLLIVWDLDHYTRIFREFEEHQTNQKSTAALFYTHIKRLGILTGLGWCLGFIALNIRINISFMVALILVLLLIFGLRQVARYLQTS